MSLLFGSRNPAKRAYYQDLLAPLVGQLLGPEDYNVVGTPIEKGTTSEANATAKACFYAERAGVKALAEDEILYVDFLPLDKQPGILGRRPRGEAEDIDDDALLGYWIEQVRAVPEGRRTGRWHVAYCLANPQGVIETLALDYEVRFYVPPSDVRFPGWPLSSIQGRAAIGKPHSETTEAELMEHDRESRARLLEWLSLLLA